jgi:hypothetical protein
LIASAKAFARATGVDSFVFISISYRTRPVMLLLVVESACS